MFYALQRNIRLIFSRNALKIKPSTLVNRAALLYNIGKGGFET